MLSGELMDGDSLVIHPISFNTASPEGWNAHYNTVIDFPEAGGPWRKIIMLQTLKCDSTTKGDEYPCGEWDYIWNIFVNVPKKDTLETFSMGSFVTPYGKRLWLGGESGWEWTYDITDYAPILKGEREIIVGNNQELLDLKFIFIKGTPTRDILQVENIYPYGHYKYADLADDTILKETTLQLLPEASAYKLKAVISGHGHAGPRNCCEWDSKTHTYYIDEWELFRWSVWKDCGNNPIYPQGGTWPFDRAGWCPGTKVDEYEYELTPFVKPGDSITIDYGIEPYSDNGEKDGEFRQSHQLFSYGAPNFKNDAEIVDIIVPSSKGRYSRSNPALSNPKIIIKNTGANDLKHLEIYYGLSNGKKSLYHWHGNLSFLGEEELALPNLSWRGLKYTQLFEVEIKKANGLKDENPQNNLLTSVVSLPMVFPRTFILNIKTNNVDRSRENSFTISDNMGTVYYSGESFADSTEYSYTIDLERGFFEFLFKDDMEDGISVHWWNRDSAPEKVGISGQVQFLTQDGEILYEFKPDFGQELRWGFIVGSIP
jgi:hypothetical protein